MAQKGIIKVSKTGEVFSSVTENEGVYQPVYEAVSYTHLDVYKRQAFFLYIMKT